MTFRAADPDALLPRTYRALSADLLLADPFAHRPRGARFAGWFVIVLLFLTGWWQGVLAAVRFFVVGAGDIRITSASTSWDLAWLTITAAVAAAGVLVLARFDVAPIEAGLMPAGRGGWRRQLTVGVAYMAIMAAGFKAAGLASAVTGTDFHHYPHLTYDNGWLFALDVLRSALAGPSEEIVLLGCVVWILRRNGYNWWVVTIVAVVVRIPFHLYYGPPILAAVIWPIAAVWLYRRTGALLGIVIAHSAFDVFNYWLPTEILKGLLIYGGYGLVLAIALDRSRNTLASG